MSIDFESERHRQNEAFEYCVRLVDDHIDAYVPERDQSLIEKEFAARAEARGVVNERMSRIVRYNFLESPSPDTLPPPYSEVLGRAAVIAFQKLEAGHSDPPSYNRKIELLDPFAAHGGATLMMVMFDDIRLSPTHVPAIHVFRQDSKVLETPLWDPVLTANLMHMVLTIRRYSEAGQLVPISDGDVQAMYRMHEQLDS